MGVHLLELSPHRTMVLMVAIVLAHQATKEQIVKLHVLLGLVSNLVQLIRMAIAVKMVVL